MKRIIERHEPNFLRPKEEVWQYKAELSSQELQSLKEYKSKYEEIDWASVTFWFSKNLGDSSY